MGENTDKGFPFPCLCDIVSNEQETSLGFSGYHLLDIIFLTMAFSTEIGGYL